MVEFVLKESDLNLLQNPETRQAAQEDIVRRFVEATPSARMEIPGFLSMVFDIYAPEVWDAAVKIATDVVVSAPSEGLARNVIQTLLDHGEMAGAGNLVYCMLEKANEEGEGDKAEKAVGHLLSYRGRVGECVRSVIQELRGHGNGAGSTATRLAELGKVRNAFPASSGAPASMPAAAAMKR